MTGDRVGVPDFTPYEDLVDEGGVPIFGFRMILFITPDGDQGLQWSWDGERIRAYEAVGAIEAAKLEFYDRELHPED